MNNGYTYAGFNFKNPILADKNVRQALVYGLDRAGFVQSFFGSEGGFVAHTPISPVNWAYPDMYDIFSKTVMPPGNNRGFFENDEIEKLMLDGVNEFDQEKRKTIYQDLAIRFNEELPYMFVYIRKNPYLVNKRVKNFNPSEFKYWSADSYLIEIAK